MTDQPKVLRTASFNPLVKTYILIYVALILFITVAGWPILVLWLFGFGQWYSKHYYNKLECEVTERVLRFKKGILIQVEKTIPLENIQDLTFIEGPLLRHFNLCVLKVETAGQGNSQDGNEMKLIGINEAREFKNLVIKQREVLMDRKSGGGSTDDSVLADIRTSVQNIEALLEKKSADD